MAEDVTSVGDDIVWHPIFRVLHYSSTIRHYGDDGEQHAIMSVLDLNVPRVYKGNMLLRRMDDDVLGLVTVLEWCLQLCAMEVDSSNRLG